MLFKKEKDEVKELEEYLKKIKYPHINSAITNYKLAMAKLNAYCFNANEDLILSVIKTIVNSDIQVDFNKQFKFAEELFVSMQIDIQNQSEILDYLNNLSVCLNNPTIIPNFKSIKSLYLLFEDKSIVQGIIETVTHLNEIIDYIIEARQYYIDEHALCSAALSLDKKIDTDENAIRKQLAQDRENAGIYNLDYDALKVAKEEAESLSEKLTQIKQEIKELENRKAEISREIDEQLKRDVNKKLDELLGRIHEEKPQVILPTPIGIAINTQLKTQYLVSVGKHDFYFNQINNCKNIIFDDEPITLDVEMWEKIERLCKLQYPDGFPYSISEEIIDTINEQHSKTSKQHT